ncbi:ABC transporter permease [Ruegeria marina]|uniref:Transport permease protein n=1 Tax=Ruegeria marina TaxID=639004 RepID=A0A1G6ZQB8_9RHOB|nr:ABC transporter permease [Ruegeria marina]SDE04045.1 ABC-2 type transport system permease protein [Ruegeria marina]
MIAADQMTGAIDTRVIWALWRREVTSYLRDRSQVFGGFSRTVLWLVILGFGLGATLREIEGYSYSQYILPGVMVLNVLFASMQSAFALVYDRKHGLLRQVLVSPAPLMSVTLGKLSGGATIAVLQGSIPLLFAPVIGVPLSLPGLLAAWAVMFAMGFALTGVGVVIALRLKGLQGFGSISNGVIQPLYFLSGSIFPLKGIVGGIGFLDIPQGLRDELRSHGIYAIGGGWVVELPLWLEVIVRANPISYQLDLMREALLGYHQLPQDLGLAICAGFPLAALAAAYWALSNIRQG